MTTKIAGPLIAARFSRCPRTMGLRNCFWTLPPRGTLLLRPARSLNSLLFNRERHSSCLAARLQNTRFYYTAIIIQQTLVRSQINCHTQRSQRSQPQKWYRDSLDGKRCTNFNTAGKFLKKKTTREQLSSVTGMTFPSPLPVLYCRRTL